MNFSSLLQQFRHAWLEEWRAKNAEDDKPKALRDLVVRVECTTKQTTRTYAIECPP